MAQSELSTYPPAPSSRPSYDDGATGSNGALPASAGMNPGTALVPDTSAAWQWLSRSKHLSGTPGPTASRSQVVSVLAEWRAAERSLAQHLEVGPERRAIQELIRQLRQRYHQLVDEAYG